jgi:hypothetical protein
MAPPLPAISDPIGVKVLAQARGLVGTDGGERRAAAQHETGKPGHRLHAECTHRGSPPIA